MITARSLSGSLMLSSCVWLTVACGGDSESTASGTGGQPAASGGESNGAGGTAPSGGGSASESGGATASGGAAAGTGGASPMTGGSPGTGGGGEADASPGDASASGDAGPGPDGDAGPRGDAGPPKPCRTNADCAEVAGTPLCHAASGDCIACHTNAQCDATKQCVNNVCAPRSECHNSLDCESAADGATICDMANGVCVECTATADCDDGEVCSGRACLTECDSDNDCTGLGLLCNRGILFGGRCTQCIESSDCDDGEYCEAGVCVPQTCKPAQQSCVQNNVVQCNETGSGVTPLQQCTLLLLSSCLVEGDNASCVGACENGRQDGFETAVDCGGPGCPRCESGEACQLPRDCTSNGCSDSVCD